jgi:hypothetical protein
MKLILILLLLIGASCLDPLFASEDERFIDTIGEFNIPESVDKIQVTAETEAIQFRIRGAGPSKPVISDKNDWFIYPVDKDHFWVYLGNGRLFYYSWQSDSRSRVDEWTYPLMGDVPLPKAVEERIKSNPNQS